MDIEKEFESFFEFDTEDKSQVSSVSCKLFAEHVTESLRNQLAECQWISVETKLPEGVVLVSYQKKYAGNLICKACYFKKHEQETNDDDHYDYNEEDDTYYIPEGWYECIDNWDDYSSVAIQGVVTH
jgi:hypothetical protein